MEEIECCIELSNDSLKTSSDHPSGLCTVCRKIDFVSSTSETCCDKDERHFHIGTLQAVTKKEFCPGYRLILSTARSINPSWNITDETNVTIQQSFPHINPWNPTRSLRKKKTVEDVAEIGTIKKRSKILPITKENLIDVILENKFKEQEAGTIIRTGEAQPTDIFDSKSTIFQSEESFCVRGRNVPSEVNISLIKDWMQSCSVQHEHCRLPILEIAREQNIGLVDVLDYRIISAISAEKVCGAIVCMGTHYVAVVGSKYYITVFVHEWVKASDDSSNYIRCHTARKGY